MIWYKIYLKLFLQAEFKQNSPILQSSHCAYLWLFILLKIFQSITSVQWHNCTSSAEASWIFVVIPFQILWYPSLLRVNISSINIKAIMTSLVVLFRVIGLMLLYKNCYNIWIFPKWQATLVFNSIIPGYSFSKNIWNAIFFTHICTRIHTCITLHELYFFEKAKLATEV